MKSHLIIVLILGLIAPQVLAAPVSEETARTVAVNWYSHYAPVDINSGQITVDQLSSFSSGEWVDCYVYAFQPAGFVIVSGDDATIPVIGYSHQSPIQTELTHPAVREFFENVQAQLLWVRQESIDNSTALPLWREVLDDRLPLHDRDRDVTPLLATTWNQGCGYNEDCPVDGDGPCGHVWAGCVATAMAQVMKYWAHPAQGVGSHGYTHPDYGYQYVDFSTATYNWAGMPNDYGEEDIAELLYHCGVALEMDYGPDGSGAYTGTYGYPNVVSVLEDYFDYQTEADYLYKSDYSDSIWDSMLREQLDEGQPLVYRGQSRGGHAFVCDGYQGDDYFHFNWGWSGSYDGYFYLDDLTPGSHEYTIDQGAVFDIRPNEQVIPDPVDDLTITLQGEDDVLLEWSAVVGANEYSVYRLSEPYALPGTLLGTTIGTSYTLLDELQSQSMAFYVVTVVYSGAPPGFTFIPAGTFMMGQEGVATPVHQVTLTHNFYLNTHEVTNEEYRTALQWAYDQGLVTASSSTVQAHGVELLDLDDNDCEITFSGGVFGLRESPSSYAQSAYPDGYDPSDHPVKEVSWYGSACYCDWLSLMDGVGAFYNGNWDQTAAHNPYTSLAYRLPTEAEWEYAARYNDDRTYPWGDETPDCDYANFYNSGYCVGWTSPVGSYPLGASQLSLHDMAGNVWEWVGDWYGSYSGDSQEDPLGVGSGSSRVGRGGGWYSSADGVRSANRGYGNPALASGNVGFRSCRTN